MKNKRIAILTITPTIGFGGILQAYALKSILEQITGSEVHVINYTHKLNWRFNLRFFINSFKELLNGRYAKLTYRKDLSYRQQNVKSFISLNLNLTKELVTPEALHAFINNHYDVLVIGSDQVWRPKYVLGIENYFAEGIDKKIRVISYAASFGVDEWEYDEKETDICGKLLSRFEYISVRESSGVGLINKRFKPKLPVYSDLDPTLLLPKSFYEKHVHGKKYNQYIFTYILDENPKISAFATKFAEDWGKPMYRFNTNAENSEKSLSERIAPPVEDWLSGIYHADFVITDSFHGMVFSIIFNKDFVVFSNKGRGECRFTSLLSALDLQDCIVSNLPHNLAEFADKRIDWTQVNKKLQILRINSLDRLKSLFINN